MAAVLEQVDAFLAAGPVPPSDLESAPLGAWPPPGTISADRSAIVGHGQWMDLYAGSNDYLKFYAIPEVEGHAVASAWHRYISHFRNQIENRGIDFINLIIPNKASVLFDHYPIALPSDMTPALRHLMELEQEKITCPVEAFRDPDRRLAVFRRNDSHLTMYGSYGLLFAVLDRLAIGREGLPLPPKPVVVAHIGDLGRKFPEQSAEQMKFFKFTGGDVTATLLSVNDAIQTGTHYVTRNTSAAIRKKILIFGDSYINKFPSWGAATHFAYAFSEMMFYWSAAMDMTIVDEFKPDIVVYQNCERFLARLPRRV